jgi:hypothetical protein
LAGGRPLLSEQVKQPMPQNATVKGYFVKSTVGSDVSRIIGDMACDDFGQPFPAVKNAMVWV